MYDENRKPDLSDICQVEKDLISALKTVISHGVFSKDVDTKELGELVDMIKDVAETKRNCWEAHYYETVSKAMEEYAPSGTGDMTSGYTPRFNKMPMEMRYDDIVGYSNNKNESYNDRYGNTNNRYGNAYMEYEDARRHYTETRSQEDKTHMEDKAMEHVNQSMMTLREIWKNADPMVKREVSNSVASLASEFKAV